MIGNSTCIGCIYPALNGGLYSKIGVGLLFYPWKGQCEKPINRVRQDTILTPFLCSIVTVLSRIVEHTNLSHERIKSN